MLDSKPCDGHPNNGPHWLRALKVFTRQEICSLHPHWHLPCQGNPQLLLLTHGWNQGVPHCHGQSGPIYICSYKLTYKTSTSPKTQAIVFQDCLLGRQMDYNPQNLVRDGFACSYLNTDHMANSDANIEEIIPGIERGAKVSCPFIIHYAYWFTI